MRKIKLTLLFLLIVIIGFVTVSCGNNIQKSLAEFVLKYELKYANSNEKVDLKKVDKNLYLEKEKDGIVFEWISKNQKVLTNDGKIIQEENNKDVVLLLTVKKDGKEAFRIFKLTILQKNEKLYNNYSVKFNSNGGTEIGVISVKENYKVIKPNDPKNGNKVFLGWYIDETLENLFDFNTTITKDMTLYAKWENKQSVNVYDTIYEVRRKTKGDSVTVLGYLLGEGFKGGYFIQDKTAAIVLYVKSDEAHTKSFLEQNIGKEILATGTLDNYNGLIEVKDIKSVSLYTSGEEYPRSLDITSFDKNQLLEIQGQLVNIQNSLVKSVNKDSSGNFNINISTTSFEILLHVDSRIKEYNSIKEQLDLLEVNKTYNFNNLLVSWHNNNIQLNSSQAITITLGQIPDEDYIVNFDLDGGVGNIPDNQTVHYGNKVIEPSIDIPTKEGFEFKGWTKTKSSLLAYDFNSPVASNMTLYAIWKKIGQGGSYVGSYYDEAEGLTGNQLKTKLTEIEDILKSL